MNTTHACLIGAALMFTSATALAVTPAIQSTPVQWDLQCSVATVTVELEGEISDAQGALVPFSAQIDMAVGCWAGMTTSQTQAVFDRAYDSCLAAGAASFECATLANDAATVAADYNEQMAPQVPAQLTLKKAQRNYRVLEPLLPVWSTQTLEDGNEELWLWNVKRTGDFDAASIYYVDEAAGLMQSCEPDSLTTFVGKLNFAGGTLDAHMRTERELSCTLSEHPTVLRVIYDVPVEGYRQ